MKKARGAENAQELQEVSDETVGAAIEGVAAPAVVAPAAPKREIIVDKGGGQLHVTLAKGEPDKYVQLRVNKNTVDSQKSVNGKVTLKFQNGWPVGDFQYEVV